MTKRFLRALAEDTSGAMGTPIRFTATNDIVARDGREIAIDAWQLENYRANPVVLWAHDYGGTHLPIGRGNTDNWPSTDITFDMADPFAAEVERKYRDGFLNAISVGWNTREQTGRKITKAELLDISAVPVPVDPGALIERQHAGLRALRDDIDRVLADEPEDAEAEWHEAARAMVTVFVSPADDAEEDRRQRYNALLPAYRRAEKTPPEWLDGEYLAGLDADTMRGLFLAGEPELCPGAFERGPLGRVLDTLMGAQEAIAAAIQHMQPGDSTPGTEEPAPDTTADDEAAVLAQLTQLSKQLEELQQ